MIRKGNILHAIALIAFICLSACSHPHKKNGCSPIPQPLLLDESDFPPGWSISTQDVNDDYSDRAIDHCVVDYYVTNGSALQEIYYFETEVDAIQDYKMLSEIIFWKDAELLPFPSYVSDKTDDFRVMCAIPRYPPPMCMALARYGNIIVHFNTHYRPEFMTEEDLVKILESIDANMVQGGFARE